MCIRDSPYTPAAGDGLTESNGVWTGTFTLSESAGLTRVFSGIPVGASYTVSETDLPAAIAGSTWQLINKTGDSGTLPENGATAVSYTHLDHPCCLQHDLLQ